LMPPLKFGMLGICGREEVAPGKMPFLSVLLPGNKAGLLLLSLRNFCTLAGPCSSARLCNLDSRIFTFRYEIYLICM
jgi:hypothetical protein